MNLKKIRALLMNIFVTVIATATYVEAADVPQPEPIHAGDGISFCTRARWYINCYDSRGKVGALQMMSADPMVSDEIFTICSLNGGMLKDGDKIFLQTRWGWHLNCLDSKGTVSAIQKMSRDPAVSDEIFTIHNLNGGTIKDGDKIFLQTRRDWFINCLGSKGTVSAVQKMSRDPKVSDELLNIFLVNPVASAKPSPTYLRIETDPPGAWAEIGCQPVLQKQKDGTILVALNPDSRSGRVVGPTPCTVELKASDIGRANGGVACILRKAGYWQSITGVSNGYSETEEGGVKKSWYAMRLEPGKTYSITQKLGKK